MSKPIKVHDVFASEVVAIADLAHEGLEYAKKGYKKAQVKRKKDSSILIIVDNQNTEHIDAMIELTVEDAEALALHILSLCGAVKHDWKII